MHRLILLSSTYRQESLTRGSSAAVSVDPANRLLWRQNPRRFEAEVLRDSILASCGALSLRMAGPSVFPRLPKGLNAGRYKWKPTEDPAERNRRSIYLIHKRNLHLPFLKNFDLPDNHASCARRLETTTPPQALTLLNSRWMIEKAQRFASRLIEENGGNETTVVDRAYGIAFSRAPTPAERSASKDFLREGKAAIRERLANNEPVALPELPEGLDPAFGAALVDYCHALWNTNEFVYVD